MKIISDEEANKKYGIKNNHSIMDNGELRFRLVCDKDNTSYIRTESGDIGYWQNSHYHTSIKETYIVQKGKILFAYYKNDKLEIKELIQDDICTTELNIPHNVYMYPKAVVHTVKHGNIDENDWIEYKELDEILRGYFI